MLQRFSCFFPYRNFPPSLMLERKRKTTLEHGSSFLFLRFFFFFLNMEPEVTFPNCCIDGRKGHFFFARNTPFIADGRVEGLTYQ